MKTFANRILSMMILGGASYLGGATYIPQSPPPVPTESPTITVAKYNVPVKVSSRRPRLHINTSSIEAMYSRYAESKDEDLPRLELLGGSLSGLVACLNEATVDFNELIVSNNPFEEDYDLQVDFYFHNTIMGYYINNPPTIYLNYRGLQNQGQAYPTSHFIHELSHAYDDFIGEHPYMEQAAIISGSFYPSNPNENRLDEFRSIEDIISTNEEFCLDLEKEGILGAFLIEKNDGDQKACHRQLEYLQRRLLDQGLSSREREFIEGGINSIKMQINHLQVNFLSNYL